MAGIQSIQDAIYRKLSYVQNKITDTLIQILGTGADCFQIILDEDKYKNKEYKITGYNSIYALIAFPDNEVPVGYSTNQNEQSSQVLHMYDLLPITCHFKNEDMQTKEIRKGNILLYKIKMADATFQVLPLEIIDLVAKATVSNIVWVQWNLALPTNFAFLQSLEYQRIVETFKNTNTW
jgi:hypothetical protein